MSEGGKIRSSIPKFDPSIGTIMGSELFCAFFVGFMFLLGSFTGAFYDFPGENDVDHVVLFIAIYLCAS